MEENDTLVPSVRIKLGLPWQVEPNRWKSTFREVSDRAPLQGIYQSEITSERYRGRLTGVLRRHSLPENRRIIELTSDLPETTLQEGEMLQVIEVLIPARQEEALSEEELRELTELLATIRNWKDEDHPDDPPPSVWRPS
jgi:hypothetical protein